MKDCAKCNSDGTCMKCIDGYGMDITLGYCVYCAVYSTGSFLNCAIPALKFCELKSDDGFYCFKCISTDLVFDTQ